MAANLRPLAGILLLLGACYVGPSVKRYAPAHGPAGATVQLGLPGDRTVGGELLAVEDSTLLLLEARQLVRVDIASIRSLRGPNISTRAFGDAERERLRLISRYPQGVSPELEASLLRAYGAGTVGRKP